MDYGDKVFKLLNKCNRQHNNHDLHGFKANIESGFVFVDCRGFEIFIENIMDDGKKIQWAGAVMAATNRLEMLGIDLDSVEM